MPNREEHCRHTSERYGVTGDDIHEWMDEPSQLYGSSHRWIRHDLEKIREDPEYVPSFAREKYGLDLARNIMIDHVLLDREKPEALSELENSTERFKQVLLPSAESFNDAILMRTVVLYGGRNSGIKQYYNTITNLVAEKYGKEKINAWFYPNKDVTSPAYRDTKIDDKQVQVVILDFIYGDRTLYDTYSTIAKIPIMFSSKRKNGYLLVIINTNTLYRFPPELNSFIDLFIFKSLPAESKELSRIRDQIYQKGIEELRQIEENRIINPRHISKSIFKDRTGKIDIVDLTLKNTDLIHNYSIERKKELEEKWRKEEVDRKKAKEDRKKVREKERKIKGRTNTTLSNFEVGDIVKLKEKYADVQENATAPKYPKKILGDLYKIMEINKNSINTPIVIRKNQHSRAYYVYADWLEHATEGEIKNYQPSIHIGRFILFFIATLFLSLLMWIYNG